MQAHSLTRWSTSTQDTEKADLQTVRLSPRDLSSQRPWQRLEEWKFIFSERGRGQGMLKPTGHTQVHGPWWGELTCVDGARIHHCKATIDNLCSIMLVISLSMQHETKVQDLMVSHRQGWELVALTLKEIFHSEEHELSCLWWILPPLRVPHCPAGLTYSPYYISGLNAHLLPSFFCCFFYSGK